MALETRSWRKVLHTLATGTRQTATSPKFTHTSIQSARFQALSEVGKRLSSRVATSWTHKQLKWLSMVFHARSKTQLEQQSRAKQVQKLFRSHNQVMLENTASSDCMTANGHFWRLLRSLNLTQGRILSMDTTRLQQMVCISSTRSVMTIASLRCHWQTQWTQRMLKNLWGSLVGGLGATLRMWKATMNQMNCLIIKTLVNISHFGTVLSEAKNTISQVTLVAAQVLTIGLLALKSTLTHLPLQTT